MEVRQADGTHYKTTSLQSIHAGINRHVKSVRSEIIDINKDLEFTNANVAFEAATVKLKRMGKGDVKHHKAIDHEDIEGVYKFVSFFIKTPQLVFRQKYCSNSLCIFVEEDVKI